MDGWVGEEWRKGGREEGRVDEQAGRQMGTENEHCPCSILLHGFPLSSAFQSDEEPPRGLSPTSLARAAAALSRGQGWHLLSTPSVQTHTSPPLRSSGTAPRTLW